MDTPSEIIRKPAAIDRWPRGIAYRNGFSLLGTPIGFRGARNLGMRFISNLDERQPVSGERVLASRFLCEALGWSKRGVDVLALSYGQKIKLGRMELALYPAGLHPGSAQLEIAYRNRRILYCGGVSLHVPLGSPPVEIPTCDLLLIDVVPADPKPPSPRQEIGRLVAWLKTIADSVPVLVCGSRAAALEVIQMLGETDRRVHAQRSLFDMFRRTASLGARIPEMRRLGEALPQGSVVLHAADGWTGSRYAGASGIRVAYAGPGRNGSAFAEATFRLGEGADRPALVNYVERTGAGQVAIGAACDDGLASLLEKRGITTYRIVHPTQMPLPFKTKGGGRSGS